MQSGRFTSFAVDIRAKNARRKDACFLRDKPGDYAA
jgi:hypothetical protein